MTTLLRNASSNMADSTFCLCPRGKTPGTRRIWEALAHCCVPVILSDTLKLPFTRHAPLGAAILRVPEADAAHTATKLLAVSANEVASRRSQACRQRHAFVYHGVGEGTPGTGVAQPGDAYYQVLLELQDRRVAAWAAD